MRRGRFSRAYLCSSLGLQPRDLRRLDSVSACNGSRKQLPTLLVRPQTILLSCEFVRAVIRRDRVLFFEGDQGTSPAGSPLERSIEGSKEQILHSLLVRELQGKLKATQSASEASDSAARGSPAAQPFEFVVIETILQSVLQSLQDEFDLMAPPIESHLTLLERFIHWDRLRTLLECKKRVASFHERITHLRGCLTELLESDADMAAMYLTEGAERREPRPSWAHEEMELLLESYLKLAEEIASRVQLLAANIHSTEDIVNIGLVGQRNELLLLELKLGIGTFAASMGGFGAALLGMNLTNGWEAEGSAAFWAVVVTLGSVAMVAFTASWRRMLKLIRKY
jgi:magnesium transporter